MWTRTFLRRCLVAVALAPGMLAATWAAPEYRVTVVGPPDSRANAINNDGAVVGTYPANAANTRAFLGRGRGWVDLGAIGVSSGATAINDRGQVLGNWRSAGGEARGVIWHRGGQADIGIVPGAAGARFVAINNAGYTVALANINGLARSYLRAPNGTFQELGSLPATNPITEGHALNNRNQVTGATAEFSLPEIPFRAFTWTRGVMRDLGDAGSAPNGGNDINDRGQVVGYVAVNGEGPHDRIAFIATHGRLQDIDGRPANSGRYSQGQGIKNLGHAVGDSDHLSGWVYRGRRMQSLNALIDPTLGWSIQLPRDINDAGQIAATGARNGQYYAVRLDLIRPHGESAPVDDDGEAAMPGALLSPAQTAAEARPDAEAQAREVVRPVQH